MQLWELVLIALMSVNYIEQLFMEQSTILDLVITCTELQQVLQSMIKLKGHGCGLDKSVHILSSYNCE